MFVSTLGPIQKHVITHNPDKDPVTFWPRDSFACLFCQGGGGAVDFNGIHPCRGQTSQGTR
jgi:hypothetical protein